MSKISVTTIAGLTSGGDANKVKIESGDDFVVDTDTLYVNSSTNGVGVGTTTPSNFCPVLTLNIFSFEPIEFTMLLISPA